jgi:glycosyltransferase involved in cell wall biosynthesis
LSDRLISVVIPVYNRERYLAEAIESVLTQDYAPIDLIVVDDGSTDGTAAIVAGMGAKLRYVYQPNQGIAGARNTGVTLARGSFLAFLDSDDLWLTDKLSRQMAVFAAQPETDVVYGHAEQFCSPEIEPEFWRRFRVRPGVLPAPLSSSMLIRRAAFDGVGPFDPRFGIGIEMDWHARLAERKLRVTMLPEVVFRRRLHRSNFNIEHGNDQSERLHVLKAVIDRRRRLANPS